jgi:hypothetical protein
VARTVTRTERLLRTAQATGMRRGVLGGSPRWVWVFVGTYLLRRLRKAIGSEPVLVYRGELKPGQSFTIDHRPETYDGHQVKRRGLRRRR